MTWEYVNNRPPTLAVRQANPGFRIRLVTVPHTGTFFTLGLLKQMGISHDHHHIKTWNPELVTYWADRPNHKSWILCTLRDPMLAVISSTNRGDRGHFVEAWRIPASWQGAPNVHFFPVDGPIGERAQVLRELAGFAGARIPSTNWVPVHTSPDVLDLKADYQRGVIKPEIRQAFDALSGLDDVNGLFAAHGYSLPWMA